LTAVETDALDELGEQSKRINGIPSEEYIVIVRDDKEQWV